MRTAAKVAIGALGCLVALAAITAGAGYWLWRAHGPAFLESGKAAIERGENEGRTLTEQQCLDTAIERHRTPQNLGMGSAIKENLRLRGCLEASTPSAEFCEGVPRETEILQSALWISQRCQALNFTDSYCQQLFKPVIKYCESPERKRKL